MCMLLGIIFHTVFISAIMSNNILAGLEERVDGSLASFELCIVRFLWWP